MDKREERGLKVAEFLLQIKAVKLQPKEPFTWASGWKSPIYCDNRLSLSYPDVRTYIRQEISTLVDKEFSSVDLIAGVATGGIAIGALVAQELGLPFCYIRSSSKGHGLENQIEGVVPDGQSVVVIEDLISTGMSSLKAVNALRAADLKVKGMIAIFSYGFSVAHKNFKEAGCDLYTLSNYETLISQALDGGYITDEDVQTLRDWRRNPEAWGQTVTS